MQADRGRAPSQPNPLWQRRCAPFRGGAAAEAGTSGPGYNVAVAQCVARGLSWSGAATGRRIATQLQRRYFPRRSEIEDDLPAPPHARERLRRARSCERSRSSSSRRSRTLGRMTPPNQHGDRPPSAAEIRAIAHGIDPSLIDENLRLAPIERLRRHDDALNFALRLHHATEAQYGAAQPAR